MRPYLIVQQTTQDSVEQTREGLGRMDGVIVLGVRPEDFWRLAGLDALFLTLPRAEAWGSKPLPPHVCEVLRTRAAELKKGFPTYVVTGMVLKDEDPKTGQFAMPLLVKSAIGAVLDFNRQNGNLIQTVGLTELERLAPELSPREMGELIRAGYEAALSSSE